MAPSHPQPDPKQKISDPDALVRRADEKRGMPAAELLLEAALAYRRRPDIVAAMHSLQRGLAELAELIESPPAAKLGAELEYQLGILCEEELGRFEDALVHYQRAFKLRPDNLDPLRRGRFIYQSLGDMDMVARLIELHLANLVASETHTGIGLALELGQLKLKLNDPAGAVDALRSALRMHNEAAANEEIPENLLGTLADAYVSPDYQPGISEKEQARRHASEIYLSLAKRYLDPKLLASLPSGDGDDEPPPPPRPTEATADELRDGDKKAIGYLRRALEADARNVTAAGLLETLFGRMPAPQRSAELIKLYKSGARVSRRGPKLLKLYEETGGPVDFGAVIDACRTGLDAVNSVDEWNETRDTLKDMLQKSGDLLGLAAVREEDASEAALPEERADLLMQAADLYQRGGDQERHIACLKQAFHELPLHTEAFRKLSDYYKSRRDFIGLAVIQENRMAAQFETARLDLASYSKQLEELGELYEKKLQDVVSAAAIWRRIDELLPSARSQSERKRLAQRLQRIDQQVSELQIELERTSDENVPGRIELLRRLAQLYRELHEPKHAASVYELLLQLSPTDLPSMKILIELREQSGDVPGQLELLRQQVGLVTDRAERLALLRRMMALCDQRMLQRDERWDAQDGIGMTIWVCRALLAELPSDRDALRRLSEALALLGNKSELLEVLEAYLKVAPTPREKLSLHRQIAKVAEDAEDLARAVSHLERAVRICPPGPESEETLSELARIYGRQERIELAVQTLELSLKQNPRASVELFRHLGRLTLGAESTADAVILDKSVRALREVLARVPDDQEALTGLQRLYRRRGDWGELQAILEQMLRVSDPPLPPRERLTIGLELSEVISERFGDPKKAAALIEQVQAESPVVDLRVHRRLRILYEEMGDIGQAARYAERELLLTEDSVARMERALDIAALWRTRGRDTGRALLCYERVLQIAPELPATAPEAASVRTLSLQALEAMSQMFIAEGRWAEVVMVGQRRLGMAIDASEAVPAAMILMELAQIYEEKLNQASDGFALRQQAFDLAPHMVSLEQLSAVAEKYGLWKELCALHTGRVDQALEAGAPLPLDSVLAASGIYEKQLNQPAVGFKLLRRVLPQTPEAALLATTPGTEYGLLLDEMRRLVSAYGKGSRDDDSEAMEGITMVRELLHLYRGLVDELCKRKDAGSEEMAVRLHRLHAASAQLREQVNGDPSGALSDRLHAFTVGGERDYSEDLAANLVFAETVREIHRLAALSGMIKEAISVDNRRMERADSEIRRQQVACEHAAWLDENGGDPQKALRACIKALTLCEEGSDAQAEMRGRLYRLGQRLGLLAWDEIARAERGLAGQSPQRLRQRLCYLASLWQYGAVDFVRAIDAAGQAFRLCYFPNGLPQAGKSGPPLSELVVPNPDAELIAERTAIRQVLDRIALSAPSDGEGNSKLVALLDNLTTQLNEAGTPTLAAQLLLDAGQVDERRGRLAQAERRYQEALKHPTAVDQALAALEKLYRQQRRLTDLAALLERRRPLLPESAQYGVLLDLAEVYREVNKVGPALAALNQAIALDDRGAAPHLLMARLYEGQRTFTRAVEAYRNAASREGSPDKALHALVAAASLSERKLEEPAEALELYRQALGRAYAAFAALRAEGRLPESSPELVADRDAAWEGAERLLRHAKDLGGLDDLYVDRLTATPETETSAHADRSALLKGRLELLLTRRSDGARAAIVDPAILETVTGLVRLHPHDDVLLAEKEELLRSLGHLVAARDVALQRARSAAERGVEPAVQIERWVDASGRELDLGNFAGAEAALEQALALAPDALPVLGGLVELHRRAGNPAAEVRALIRLSAGETDPERAVRAELQAAAVTQRQLGDTAAARSLLRKALARVEGPSQATPTVHAEVLAALFELERHAGAAAEAADYGRRALSTGTVPPEQAAEVEDYLGQTALAFQRLDEAEGHFEAALRARPGLLGPTRALIDLLQPSADYARIDQLLEQALAQNAGLAAPERAELLRRQAEARQALGRHREAYQALVAAEELSPGDVAAEVWLGESAYELGEYPEAARHLGALLQYADQPESLPAPLTAERLADALDHAGESERQLARPGQARRLWQAALRLLPEHAGAADHYLVLLLEEENPEDAAQALALLGGQAERHVAAGNVAGAVGAYLRGARLAFERLGDPGRAHSLLLSAYAHLPAPAPIAAPESEEALHEADTTEVPPVTGSQLPPELGALQRQLLEQLLDSARRLGDLPQAQAYAEQLAELSEEPADKSRYLQQAADCALAGEQAELGKGFLLKALRYAGPDLDLLSRLAPLLDDSEAVAMLPVMLEGAAASGAAEADPATRAGQLTTLYRHLAAAQVRLGEGQQAAESYDHAIAAAGPLGTTAELELRRQALDVVPESDAERTRLHLGALLHWAPLDRELLGRLQRLESQVGHAGAAWRIGQVLHLLDPSASEAPPPATPVPSGLKLDEADHARWALPEARVLGEVLAALWDGVIGLKAPPLDAFGVASNDKVPGSESSPDELARTFGMVCRVLGNQRCGMYRQGWQQHLLPRVFARMPTGLIISPALGKRPLPEVQFIIARAVEGLRPEYILALCLPPRELSHVLGLAVRGFHPRHARIPAEDVAAWKRELPYRTVKRLGEVFRDQPDVVFSTVTWRRAVRRTLQRAALVVGGDLLAAAGIMRTVDLPAGLNPPPKEEPGGPYLRFDSVEPDTTPESECEADLRDLCAFFIHPDNAPLLDRLHPRS